MEENSNLYSKRLGKDFSRNSKLSLEKLFQYCLSIKYRPHGRFRGLQKRSDAILQEAMNNQFKSTEYHGNRI